MNILNGSWVRSESDLYIYHEYLTAQRRWVYDNVIIKQVFTFGIIYRNKMHNCYLSGVSSPVKTYN